MKYFVLFLPNRFMFALYFFSALDIFGSLVREIFFPFFFSSGKVGPVAFLPQPKDKYCLAINVSLLIGGLRGAPMSRCNRSRAHQRQLRSGRCDRKKPFVGSAVVGASEKVARTAARRNEHKEKTGRQRLADYCVSSRPKMASTTSAIKWSDKTAATTSQ